jgi:glycosyltransferase involved in cell wall biosynthesis
VAPDLSVVVPVHNGEATLARCLQALATQSLPRDRYEVVVVDDGSSDASARIAASFTNCVLPCSGRSAAAARNVGWRTAKGRWIAFTDADCVPSRSWLAALDSALSEPGRAFGAAGRTFGYQSETSAARFVDLTGGLDAERYLQHPTMPFAPTCNVVYRRDALAAIDGFDERLRSYEACDLHTRMVARFPGTFLFVPRAVVLHQHRSTWPGYWRQQYGYGQGYAQFVWHYRDRVPWTWREETRAWKSVLGAGAAALGVARDDAGLVRRGLFVKLLAQRMGFDATFWRRAERAQW